MSIADRSAIHTRPSVALKHIGLSLAFAFIPAFFSVRAQEASLSFLPKRVLGPQPVITDVPFKSVQEMNSVLNASELVLGITLGNKSRAYPINMLTGPRREIINDSLGGQAIAATW